jgi:hypothetical protein
VECLLDSRSNVIDPVAGTGWSRSAWKPARQEQREPIELEAKLGRYIRAYSTVPIWPALPVFPSRASITTRRLRQVNGVVANLGALGLP